MKLYKQEGKAGFYQLMQPFLTVGPKMLKYLPVSYEHVWGHSKGPTFRVFLDADKMEIISQELFKKCKNGFPKKWITEWAIIDKKLTSEAHKISKLNLSELDAKELVGLYQQIQKLDEEMWAISIFIDALDAGFDAPEIERITKENRLSQDEVQILLSPEKPAYISEWENLLIEVKEGKLNPEELAEKYFWIGADYFDFEEISAKKVVEKSKTAEPAPFVSPVNRQKEILQKYGLKNNPLEAFKILAQWRDDRKRMNLTGLYCLVRLLREGLNRCKASPELVRVVYPEEAVSVLRDGISGEVLKRRAEQGIFMHMLDDGSMEYIEGKKGEQEFDKMLDVYYAQQGTEVKGMVACKGRVKGVVRVVQHAHSPEAKKMQKGDILVTSMTRPEFVPLMKKAGAIVTDEGGISCHAAIVSRELNIPCIIGTKNATTALKDGDMVEVDAEKGVVRKVK